MYDKLVAWIDESLAQGIIRFLGDLKVIGKLCFRTWEQSLKSTLSQMGVPISLQSSKEWQLDLLMEN